MIKYINFNLFSIQIISDLELPFEFLKNEYKLEVYAKNEISVKLTFLNKQNMSLLNKYGDFKDKIQRFGRTCVTYYSINDNVLNVVIPLPSKPSLISKIISSYFADNINMILSDFFHGPFIGILLVNLLKTDSILLHSSCINYKDRTLILISGPQSGKTTIARELSCFDHCSVIGEDFIVIDNGFRIIPIRIPVKINIDEYLFLKKTLSFSETVNIFLYRFFNLLNISTAYRRLGYGEYFSGISDYAQAEKKFYLINRKDLSDSKNIRYTIYLQLKNEIDNLPNFNHVIKWLEKSNFFNGDSFDIFFKTNYLRLLSTLDIEEIFLPYFSNKRKLIEFFLKFHIKW